jgi:hypothetical protein
VPKDGIVVVAPMVMNETIVDVLMPVPAAP